MMTRPNSPTLWLFDYPKPAPDSHKYNRGVAVIYGASQMTGATRLAAESCARMGAGLVKVIAPPGTGDIYRSNLPAHIIVEDEDLSYPEAPILDDRTRAVVLGPGCLPDQKFMPLFHKALDAKQSPGIVMDAGAFTVWEGSGIDALQAFSSTEKVVLTPHEGELHKVFAPHPDGDSVLGLEDKACKGWEAARRLNSIMVLKGARTVISADENVVVQDQPLPDLATAGAGDVLAGMIAGLAAQGMPMFQASCAAVWIHAEAAKLGGIGLFASDLPNLLPKVLKTILT